MPSVVLPMMASLDAITVRGARAVSMRGKGGAVLAAGEPQFVRRLPGEALPAIAPQEKSQTKRKKMRRTMRERKRRGRRRLLGVSGPLFVSVGEG